DVESTRNVPGIPMIRRNPYVVPDAASSEFSCAERSDTRERFEKHRIRNRNGLPASSESEIIGGYVQNRCDSGKGAGVKSQALHICAALKSVLIGLPAGSVGGSEDGGVLATSHEHAAAISNRLQRETSRRNRIGHPWKSIAACQ